MQFHTGPRLFHLGTMQLVAGGQGVRDFMAALGASPEAAERIVNQPGASEGEVLVEVAGRSCYRSFEPGLNLNVSRVRAGNKPYIGNILKSKHGSVIEHAVDSIGFTQVSRILTHELIRHRTGASPSQESGRYVRVEEVSMFWPDALTTEGLGEVWAALPEEERSGVTFEEWAENVRRVLEAAAQTADSHVQSATALLGMDKLTDFGVKKRLTSALRRFLPGGVDTAIVVTANSRAWRHMIQMRTSEHAEEEIRIALHRAFRILQAAHPAIYQDAEERPIQGKPHLVPEVVFANEKV